MDAEASSIRTIVAALVGNIAIAVAKYVAAAVTGSSAMLSEAIHSTVDTGNELPCFTAYAARNDRPTRSTHSATDYSSISGRLSSP